MILQSAICKLLKTQLTALGYDSWLSLSPDEQTYPFCVYNVATSNIDQAFIKNLEYMRVTISVFDDNSSPTTSITMMNAIETLFDRNTTLTIDPAVGTLICIKKINEINPIKATSNYNAQNDDFYTMGVIEFIFIAERTI